MFLRPIGCDYIDMFSVNLFCANVKTWNLMGRICTYINIYYRCDRSSSKVEYCVAHDMLCDGVRDCPNGEDEMSCLVLSAPTSAP